MAQKVLRFRNAQPGLDLAQLRSEINDPLATIDGAEGGQYIDITADEAVEQDVISTLGVQGYDFVEENPSSTLLEAFTTSLNLDVPTPGGVGHVQISLDGTTFTSQCPLIGSGWLVNDAGLLLVTG